MEEERDIELRDLLNQTARLRLFRNKSSELGEYIGYNLNANNSINRIPPFTARCLFRELSRNVQEEISTDMDLEYILYQYKKASLFYSNHFNGKNQQANIAKIKLILQQAFVYNSDIETNNKTLALLTEVKDKEIDIPILLLLVLKILPSYTSAKGDVKDSLADAEKLLSFLRDFFKSSNDVIIDLPLLQRFEKEIQKCEYCSRLYLINIAEEALAIFGAYSNPQERYIISTSVEMISPDVADAIWVESDKLSAPGEFWVFKSLAYNCFYLYRYTIKAGDKKVSFTRYEAFFSDNELLTLIHPTKIPSIIAKQISEGMHSLFNCEMDNSTKPNRLELDSLFANNSSFRKKTLVRLSKNDMLKYYEDILSSDLYEKVDEFP
ncbi:hypothetical protein M2138_002128, partial [Dysgonomonadaceae bacterium PH5-43]|nr:hypothetical protein [Dysgonomonadaceae bacterium PH5-43]